MRWWSSAAPSLELLNDPLPPACFYAFQMLQRISILFLKQKKRSCMSAAYTTLNATVTALRTGQAAMIMLQDDVVCSR